MQQEDPFYQTLPFTLQKQQVQPDFIIFGTGLQQSAIAAHLTKMHQKKGVILDLQKTYGSSLKTVTLKELHQLTLRLVQQRLYNFVVPQKYKSSNLIFFDQCIQKKAFRGYNIDIQPSYFFGNSITCQCLKQADMDKYMDFRLVNHILKYDKRQLSQVPLSKGKIFQSKQLSLLQKKLLLTSLHTLIKLYHRHMNIQQDQNSTKQFDKGFGQVSEQLFNYFRDNQEVCFLTFLEKITKKNKKIMDYMAYIICNYQYNYNKQIPAHAIESFKLKNFIQRFGKFINSCGIYGQTPYLYVDNGIGDLPQAFSRISSIFGSTNILHPKIVIDSIQQKQDYVQIKTNLSPEFGIKTKKIYYGQTFTNLYAQKHKNLDNKSNLYTQHILRILILCKKIGNEQQCPALGYFLDLQTFENPVYLFMFDQSSHTCPPQFILYQFQTILSPNFIQSQIKDMIQKKSQILIEKLIQIRGQKFSDSISYFSSYIRKRNFLIQNNKQDEKRLICLNGSSGLDLDIHFQNFIQIVGKQQNYFRKKNPYQQQYQQQEQQYGANNILQALQNINVMDKQIVQIGTEQEMNRQIKIDIQRKQNKSIEQNNKSIEQKNESQQQNNFNGQVEKNKNKDEGQKLIQQGQQNKKERIKQLQKQKYNKNGDEIQNNLTIKQNNQKIKQNNQKIKQNQYSIKQNQLNINKE